MASSESLKTMIEGIDNGDIRLVARAITLIEDEDPRAEDLLDSIYPLTGKAAVVGITGPPGAGKSTLIEKLINHWLKEGFRIGVVAVDPTSPFTGGAILGDRIRMNSVSSDPRVFIRSMATRGSLGGLSPKINEAIQVLDAAGFDLILIETVGVGQSEVDIVKVADTVIMVTVPEAGDDIQILKSGVMEIGDIFVVNKADLPGSKRMKILLEAILNLDSSDNWRPPILLTSAWKGEGITELAAAVSAHQNFLKDNLLGKRKREYRSKDLLIGLLRDRIDREILLPMVEMWEFKRAVLELAERKNSPYQVVEELINNSKTLRMIFSGRREDGED